MSGNSSESGTKSSPAVNGFLTSDRSMTCYQESTWNILGTDFEGDGLLYIKKKKVSEISELSFFIRYFIFTTKVPNVSTQGVTVLSLP